jgi:hypothetical protein
MQDCEWRYPRRPRLYDGEHRKQFYQRLEAFLDKHIGK